MPANGKWDLIRRLKINIKKKTKNKVAISTLWRHTEGSRGIAQGILNLGARHGGVVNITPWPLNSRQGTPKSTKLEADWAPQPFWMFCRKEKSRGPCQDSGPGLSGLYPSPYTDWWIPAPHCGTMIINTDYHRQVQLTQICSSELKGTHHISLATQHICRQPAALWSVTAMINC
jgi:hypothetical protein